GNWCGHTTVWTYTVLFILKPIINSYVYRRSLNIQLTNCMFGAEYDLKLLAPTWLNVENTRLVVGHSVSWGTVPVSEARKEGGLTGIPGFTSARSCCETL